MVANEFKEIGKYDYCFNEFVFKTVPVKSECLDIGCWTGNLGEALIKKKKCLVDGVDNNCQVLNIAKRRGYRKIYNLDLNQGHFSKTIRSKYDCLILADVLEHLINPGKVLKEARNLLKKDGLIIISIPNVAFIQNRVNLLLGRFEYNPCGGLMDIDHLRFFTGGSIRRLCENAGYRKIEVEGYSLVKNRFFFLRLLAKLWPSLFALQYLVKLSK